METKKVKVLELFSGIGGMHYSLCRAKKVLNEIYEEKCFAGETGEVRKCFDFEVVSAIDISEVANKGNYLLVLFVHNHEGKDCTKRSCNLTSTFGPQTKDS